MSDEEEQTSGDGAEENNIEAAFEQNEGKKTSTNEKPMNLNEIEGTNINELKGEKTFAMGEPMASDVAAIYDIPVQISAVLGRSTMQVSQLLKLGRGAVVELDRKVGEAIDIYVNNRLVARGEVVVVEDKLGVTMTEIVKSDRA